MSGGGRSDFASSVQASTRTRQLAAPGAERSALDADDVAEVELDQRLVGVAEHVLARVQLDPAGAVGEVEERGLAVAAPAGQAAGEPDGLVGLLAVLQPGVALEHFGDRRAVAELVRERIDAGGAQLVELARGAPRSGALRRPPRRLFVRASSPAYPEQAASNRAGFARACWSVAYGAAYEAARRLRSS